MAGKRQQTGKGMKKIIFLGLIILCVAGSCYADVVKGIIEKVDLRAYQIVVNGNIVDVSRAIVFSDNDMNVTKTIIIRDLKDHKGEKAVCYGSVGKENIFIAYKVKVIEGHR